MDILILRMRLVLYTKIAFLRANPRPGEYYGRLCHILFLCCRMQFSFSDLGHSLVYLCCCPHACRLCFSSSFFSDLFLFYFQAITTQLPHYSTSRSPVAAAKGVASAPLGLSSTWRTLDYSTYAGCSQCKGQVQIV